MNDDYDFYTIEPATDGGFNVYGHGVYPGTSVLEGQSRRSFLDHFDSLEDAKYGWPEADVREGSSKPWQDPNASLADLSGLPSSPPAWFDPRAAGERWDDDY
jgi:hypothetical protein